MAWPEASTNRSATRLALSHLSGRDVHIECMASLADFLILFLSNVKGKWPKRFS